MMLVFIVSLFSIPTYSVWSCVQILTDFELTYPCAKDAFIAQFAELAAKLVSEANKNKNAYIRSLGEEYGSATFRGICLTILC